MHKLVVTPPSNADQAFKTSPGGQDVLVISRSDQRQHESYSPIGAVGVAIAETGRITYDTLTALGQMFAGTRSAKELGGIIRIGAIAGDMAEQGMISLITFTALLSINLGLINLFPIPMLDGGHLVFYAIEALKGSPLSEQLQEYAFRVGFVLLLGLMLFANINDLVQIMT
jgi:regulator of sigma E protease